MVVEKVIIVSVHVRYFSFFSFFSFFSLCLTGYVRLRKLHQVTSVYVRGTGRGARQLSSIFFQSSLVQVGVGKSLWYRKQKLSKFQFYIFFGPKNIFQRSNISSSAISIFWKPFSQKGSLLWCNRQSGLFCTGSEQYLPKWVKLSLKSKKFRK